MRMLPIAIWWVVLVALLRPAYGQYLHLYNDADGKPALAIFQGNAGWLAEQKDPQAHLHKVKTLIALWLVQHDISVAEMRYVAGLKQLRHLTIGEAPQPVSISEQAFDVLSKCTWLESVSICKEDLKDRDFEALQKLPKLKKITIEGESLSDERLAPKLTEDGARNLAAIKSLEAISIVGEPAFSDRSIDQLATLPKLTSLDLGLTRCTDRCLKTIATKMQLRELRIASPEFTDEGIALLKQETKIEELHISRGKPQPVHRRAPCLKLHDHPGRATGAAPRPPRSLPKIIRAFGRTLN